MKRRCVVFAAGGLILAAASASAQVAPVTAIVPDAAPGFSLGTTVTSAGSVHTIDGGTRAGDNLFHSFTLFDLGRGDIARWTYGAGDPTAIANVVSRVTGGQTSLIYGTLDSTALPNADFWFVNPAGILFGDGARIDVPATARFSTAQEIRFADGGVFAVSTPGGSTFSVAAPEAFGFIGGQGSIALDGVAGDFLAGTGRLVLAAADLDVRDSIMSGAAIELAAVGDDAIRLAVRDPAATTGLAGTISLHGSTLSVASRGAEAAEIAIAGGDVVIEAGSRLVSEAVPGSAGEPGRIAIRADAIRLEGDSSISSSTLSARPGGSVLLEARDIVIAEAALIRSDSLAPCVEGDCGPAGSAGDVEIRADRLVLTSSATRENPVGPTGISSDSRGRGDAGSILLDVGALIMDGPVFLTTDGFSEGKGGRLSIDADSIEMRNGALIASQTFGLGVGGEIAIRAGSLLVGLESLIQSDTGTPRGFPGFEGGQGGSIEIEVGHLAVRDTGQIRASTFTGGDAGAISILADSVELTDLGLISSDSFSGGDAGRIDILARTLLLDRGIITTGSDGTCPECGPSGDAGDISIDTETLTMRGEPGDVSLIRSDTSSDGNAGTISIRAGTVDLADGASIGSSASFGAAGDGGRIVIDADTVRLGFLSSIETVADFDSTGDAGSIDIFAGDFSMEFAAISTSSDGSGRAGQIGLFGNSILVGQLSTITSSSGRDAAAAGLIDIQAGAVDVRDGAVISSSTFGAGAGGGVNIVADRFEASGFTRILSSTFGSGEGGQVKVAAREVDLSMGADIASRAEEGSTGNAGTVRIDAGSLVMRSAGNLSSSTIGAGNAGTVLVAADSILLDNSQISSGSSLGATGGSGSVFVSTARLDIVGGGLVETISSNARPAGAIVIEAGEVRVDGPSSGISSANGFDGGGDAGLVAIDTGGLVVSNGGEISTSSVAGAAGDIVIAMPEDALLRLEGSEAPGLITTSSGPGRGGRIFIDAPRAIISNGGSILALGESGGANVQIETRFFISSADRLNEVAVDGSFLLEAQVGDVSSGTVERDLSVVDASGVLRGQCAAVRETGQVSQLVVRARGPYGAADDEGWGPHSACR